MNTRVKNLVGLRFGKLYVVKYAGSTNGNARWYCHCDCGNEVLIVSGNLRRDQSCGCSHVKHGEAGRAAPSPEYIAYKSARGRCNHKNHPFAYRYVGRGIEFRFACFQDFLREVGRKPSPIHELDRINNDGHYEPGNVRWVTGSENCRNYTLTPQLSQIRAQNMRKAQKLRWAQPNAS